MKLNPNKCQVVKPNGKQCHRKAVTKGRCTAHSGVDVTTLGAQLPRPISIYFNGMSRDEQDLYQTTEIGHLDHEIRIAKLELRRALLAREAFFGQPNSFDALQVDRVKLVGAHFNKYGRIIDLKGTELAGQSISNPALIEPEIYQSRPDFDRRIDGLIKLIAILEKTNYELKGGIPDDPEDAAMQIIAFIKNMDEKIGTDD